MVTFTASNVHVCSRELSNNFLSMIQGYALYTIASECTEVKAIIAGLVGAAIFLVVSVRFIIPLLFMSGFLALIARQLRKDLAVCIEWMKSGTRKAAVSDATEARLLEATMCEENMVESFRVLQSESGVVTLRQLDSLLRNVAGLERDRFTDKLATLLKADASTEIKMKYGNFRSFMSVLAQRIIFARSQARAHRAYRDAEGDCLLRGEGVQLRRTDVQIAARSLGFHQLSEQQKATLERMSSLSYKFERDRPQRGTMASRRWASPPPNSDTVGGAPLTTNSDASNYGSDEDDHSSWSYSSDELEFDSDDASANEDAVPNFEGDHDQPPLDVSQDHSAALDDEGENEDDYSTDYSLEDARSDDDSEGDRADAELAESTVAASDDQNAAIYGNDDNNDDDDDSDRTGHSLEEYTGGNDDEGHRSDAEVITAQNGAGDDNEDDSTNYSLEDAGIDDDEDNADDADMFVVEPAAAGVLESAVFAAHDQSVSIGNGNDGDKFRWNDGRNGAAEEDSHSRGALMSEVDSDDEYSSDGFSSYVTNESERDDGDRETSQTRDADVINEDDDHRADSTQIKAISDIPKHLTCSLTLELMVDPVFAEDGNLYERTEILKWIATNKISPLDPSCPMDASCIFPSHAVKQLIEGLVASGKLDDELCARYYQRKEALSNASELVEEDDPIGATDLPIPPAPEEQLARSRTEDSNEDDSNDESGPASRDKFDEDNETEAEPDFDIEYFLNAIHVLEKARLRDEIFQLCVKMRRSYFEAYRVYAVSEDINDGRANMVLNDAGFRAACATLNLTWDYNVLDGVINPSTKSVLARGLLRALESDLVCVIVSIFIIIQIFVMEIRSEWVAVLLAAEYIVRVCCYHALATHNLRAFLKTKSNSWDLLATLLDLLYLCAAFNGSGALLAEYPRFLRVLRLSRPVLPLFGLFVSVSRAAFRGVTFCCACLLRQKRRSVIKRRNSKAPFKAVVESYMIFRRYVSVLSQNNAKGLWPLSEYLHEFCSLESYDGSTIHANDLPELLDNLGFEGSAALRDIELITINSESEDRIFFDELVEAIQMVRNNKVESKLFERIEPRRLRAQRSLILVVSRLMIALGVFAVRMMSSLTDLAVNIYILTAGALSEDELNTDSYVNYFSAAVRDTPFADIDRAVTSLFGLITDIVRFGGDAVTLNLNFNDGVTCAGANALLVLPIIFFVTAVRFIKILSQGFIEST